ncbi:MAG: MFS transporter [Deltaproteobacteria bacterium]
MTDRQGSGLFRLLPLYIVIFIGFLGYSLMITIMTPLILENTGGILSSFPFDTDRTIALGIVLAIYPLGQFFGSPIIGAISDGFGRRPVLLVSLLITTFFYAVFAYSLEIKNLTLFMAAAFITGLAEGNIVIAQSSVSDVTTVKNRTRLFAYISLSASGAFLIGPLVGGKLADKDLVPWFSYATPYWAVFILLVLTTIFTYALFRETRPPETRTGVNYREAVTSFLAVFSPGKLRVIYLINFLVYFAIFGFFRAFPMYLVDEFGMGVSKVSNFIAWNAVPVVIASIWLTGFLAMFYTPRTITLFSMILFAIFMVFVIVPQPEPALWVTIFLPGLALAVALPASASMLSLKAGLDEQGSVLGNNLSLEVAAEVASGLGAGFLAAMFVRLPLVVFSIIALLAALMLIFTVSGREGREGRGV